ncbi:MAG: hypothetical protein GF384_06080 [Elusimicrobia bacterium]|nr:hypothetical protein [Elusimicrobiota bacterium]
MRPSARNGQFRRSVPWVMGMLGLAGFMGGSSMLCLTAGCGVPTLNQVYDDFEDLATYTQELENRGYTRTIRLPDGGEILVYDDHGPEFPHYRLSDEDFEIIAHTLQTKSRRYCSRIYTISDQAASLATGINLSAATVEGFVTPSLEGSIYLVMTDQPEKQGLFWKSDTRHIMGLHEYLHWKKTGKYDDRQRPTSNRNELANVIDHEYTHLSEFFYHKLWSELHASSGNDPESYAPCEFYGEPYGKKNQDEDRATTAQKLGENTFEQLTRALDSAHQGNDIYLQKILAIWSELSIKLGEQQLRVYGQMNGNFLNPIDCAITASRYYIEIEGLIIFYINNKHEITGYKTIPSQFSDQGWHTHPLTAVFDTPIKSPLVNAVRMDTNIAELVVSDATSLSRQYQTIYSMTVDYPELEDLTIPFLDIMRIRLNWEDYHQPILDDRFSYYEIAAQNGNIAIFLKGSLMGSLADQGKPYNIVWYHSQDAADPVILETNRNNLDPIETILFDQGRLIIATDVDAYVYDPDSYPGATMAVEKSNQSETLRSM